MTEQFLDFMFFLCMVIAIISIIVYIPRLRGWFGAIRPQKQLVNKKDNRFAIIIPAKNEGKIIDAIFKSIQNQTYAKELYDIHVIVKEENDITIEKTKAAGGYVYVASQQTCKGDALDYCIKSILKDKPEYYDAFYIVDADCLLESKCLEEMNNAMASGAQVIQSKKIVKNYLSKSSKDSSIASKCNGLIWTLIDDMGNRYKSDHGITCMTIGTGILLTSDLVAELGGWPYRQTLTEDMELMNDCAIKGYKTFYYSYSKIYVEESTSLKVTNIRRTRWLTGLIDSKIIYNSRLKEAAKDKNKKRDVYFVKALWPVFSYIGILTFSMLIQIIMGVYCVYTENPLKTVAFDYAISSFIIIYASFFIMTLFCIIVDWKNIKLSIPGKIELLFIHPLFYMGYISIIAKAFLNKNTESWVAIERVDFDDEDYIGFEMPVAPKENKDA